MNETIGSIGGVNDRKRRYKIKKKQEEKKKNEEEEIKKLEKSVKKSQRIVLIKAIPIVIVGGAIKTLIDATISKKTPESINIKNNLVFLDESNKQKSNSKREKEEEIINIKISKNNIKPDSKKHVEEKEKIKELEPFKEIEKEEIITHDDYTNLDFNDLSPKSQERLEKLKSRKIIDEYDKKLKDIRYDLRRLVYDYNEIVDEDEKSIFLSESEELLDRLSTVITKLDTLKEKIRIEDLSKYDDNYIYTLIEDYFKEFKNGNYKSEIKDSPLYIMIAEKISELDNKSYKLNEHIKEKKEKITKKEKHLDDLKNKYLDFEKVNYELLEFQNEQDLLLRKVREKVSKAETVTEKIETQFAAMDYQSQKLIKMLTLSMFIPGRRSSNRLAAATASYLFFLYQLMHPPKTKKYRIISVKDYSRDIINNISEIEDATLLLGRTSKQVEKVIKEIKTDYKEYIDVLPECKSLLNNLEKIKENINEKEYEMYRLKKDQELLLEQNNAKVLNRGKYPMSN